MDTTIENNVPKLNLTNIYISAAIVVVTMIILSVIKKYLIKKVAYTNKDEQHKNTLIGVVFNVMQYVVIIIALILVLKINGYNITSIVAGLGIMATIVGLSLQDALKDVISGITIYNNNFYKVGDVVKYEGVECEVKYFSARVTKFRCLADGSTFTVCNSLINSIQKIKKDKVIILVFDYNEDEKKINAALDNTCKKAEPIYGISNCENWGVIDINDTGVRYGIGYVANPKDTSAKSKIMKILYEELKAQNISPIFKKEIKVVQ